MTKKLNYRIVTGSLFARYPPQPGCFQRPGFFYATTRYEIFSIFSRKSMVVARQSENGMSKRCVAWSGRPLQKNKPKECTGSTPGKAGNLCIALSPSGTPLSAQLQTTPFQAKVMLIPASGLNTTTSSCKL